MLYFAYGSNLSIQKLYEKNIFPLTIRVAVLNDYKITFNKKSYKYDISYANIEQLNESTVEGLVYEITKADLKILDKIEGYPNHYYRKNVKIWIPEEEQFIIAFTYVATETKDDFYPTQEYMNMLLENSNNFTPEYLKQLQNVKTC